MTHDLILATNLFMENFKISAWMMHCTVVCADNSTRYSLAKKKAGNFSHFLVLCWSYYADWTFQKIQRLGLFI